MGGFGRTSPYASKAQAMAARPAGNRGYGGDTQFQGMRPNLFNRVQNRIDQGQSVGANLRGQMANRGIPGYSVQDGQLQPFQRGPVTQPMNPDGPYLPHGDPVMAPPPVMGPGDPVPPQLPGGYTPPTGVQPGFGGGGTTPAPGGAEPWWARRIGNRLEQGQPINNNLQGFARQAGYGGGFGGGPALENWLNRRF